MRHYDSYGKFVSSQKSILQHLYDLIKRFLLRSILDTEKTKLQLGKKLKFTYTNILKYTCKIQSVKIRKRSLRTKLF